VIYRPIVCRRLIGRRDELAYLNERRRAAGAAHGGLVLVAGEAGVGKTRLVAEFCAPLAKTRWRVARAGCPEFAQRPYGPLLDALGRIDAGAAALPPSASKHELFDAVSGAFARAAAHHAIVAVIEDVHWADTATLELLVHLAGRLDGMRMLLLVTLRPEEFHPEHPAYGGIAKLAHVPHAARIDLAPLDENERELFMDDALGDIALADDVRRAVARTSEGNPFFIEELLKSAVELRGARDAAPARHGVSPTLRATLTERLRPLSTDERRIIAQAAVIGARFDLGLLAETMSAPVDAVLPALRRARDFQLIEEEAGSAFRFRHALTREAIYGGFLAAELRPLHRTIAEVLERAPEDRRSVEALAYHWWAAGDAERAARYNELAGDAAAAVHAHDEAIAAYVRAGQSGTPDAAVRARLAEKIGDRHVALGEYDAAARAYTAAAELFRETGDAEAEASCRVRVALQKYTLDQPQPTAELEAMLERLDAGAFLARSRVHLGIAWLAATFYNPTLALRHLDGVDARALDAAPDIRLRFHNVRAWVWMILGERERFAEDHAAWIEAARHAGGVGTTAPAHYNGAFCLALFGAHEEARRSVEAALAIARDERSRHVAASARVIGAFCAVLRGDLAGARAHLDALRTLPTDNEVMRAHAMAWATLAGAHLDDAELVEHWFDRLGTTVAPFFAAICGAGCAEVLVRRGRNDEARAVLHDGIGTGERQRGNVLTLLALARYGDETDFEAARAVLARAADAACELVERHALALFDALVAQRRGRGEEARRLAARAADGFARLRFPLLEAEARELAGDRDAALALYRTCGAAHDVRRLERAGTAPAAGAAPAPPASAAGKSARNGDVLSTREREIAALVARGMSNFEIGRALSISPKTVEKHLGSAYQKLGFSTRAQLAAHASQNG